MKLDYRYRTFGINNFRKIPQLEDHLTEEQKFNIEVVGNVLPFKANTYVINELIDWSNVPNDPIYTLTFPQKGMLSDNHFRTMADAIKSEKSRVEIKQIANQIRMELNPHPAGQMEYNVPSIEGTKLTGIQHKYDQTMLFFPNHGQTCHAYCTFCFRWPQFVGINEWKFAMRESELMVKYIRQHPEITDVLFTGGDPMIMKINRLEEYIQPLLDADLPNLKNIRIGTKSLGYWPYRFTDDKDADEVLRLFEKVKKAGKQLAFMGHFNHPAEMETEAVKVATQRILNTGAQIRTQSPIMKNINDRPGDWARMWKEQVEQGMIPYYMFVARDTGAQDYFALPLVQIQEIFQEAYQQVSGICRTVRGPSMSAEPGKVQMLGTSEVNGEKVMVLRFLQGRNADWVHRPFFAEYDEKAIWLDDLKPAFGEDKWFWTDEYHKIIGAGENEISLNKVEEVIA